MVYGSESHCGRGRGPPRREPGWAVWNRHHIYGMVTFRQWLSELTGPGPAELVAIIRRVGNAGISRKQLDAIFTLPGHLLNNLLAAHCQMGFIRATTEGDETIYRALSRL